MGTNADQLPLVQHVLMRLWRMAAARGDGEPSLLRLDDYEKLGGIGSASAQSRTAAYGPEDAADGTRLNSALSAHADEILAELTGPQQHLAAILFRALTESEGAGGRDVRHPVTLGEAAAIAGVPPDELVPIVEAFRAPGRNLLVPPSNVPLTPDTVIDISHESLIRQWAILRQWVREEYRAADTYGFLETTAKLWRKGQAALLTMPYLGVALAWRNEQSPNAAWSARYGDAFDLAMEFLAGSEQAEKTRIEQEEAVRRRSTMRTRTVAVAMTVLAFLAAGLAYYGFHTAHVAQTNAEEAQRAQSRFLARDAFALTGSGNAGTGMLVALAALPKDLAHPDGRSSRTPKLHSNTRLAICRSAANFAVMTVR